MHFWRADYFKTLKDVAAEARAVPEWADYAAFCEEYERGLRSKAFAILEHFMSSLERATFAKRQRFVSWLSRHADRREGRHMLIPHPLHVRIVEPTLLEWTVLNLAVLNHICGSEDTTTFGVPLNWNQTTS